MKMLNVVDKIGIEAKKISSLISDLSSPAQNPAYSEPTKEEIVDILEDVLDIFADAQIEIENLNDELNYYLAEDYDD